jgi:hypothetical protein
MLCSFFNVRCTSADAVGAKVLVSVRYFDGSAKGRWLLET